MLMEELEGILRGNFSTAKLFYDSISLGTPSFRAWRQGFDSSCMATWPLSEEVRDSLARACNAPGGTEGLRANGLCSRLVGAAKDWLDSGARAIAYDTRLMDPRTWLPEHHALIGRVDARTPKRLSEMLHVAPAPDSENDDAGRIQWVARQWVKPWWEAAILSMPTEEIVLVEEHSRTVVQAYLFSQKSSELPATCRLGRAQRAIRKFEMDLASDAQPRAANAIITGNGKEGFRVSYDSRAMVPLSPALGREYDTLRLNRNAVVGGALKEMDQMRRLIEQEVKAGQHAEFLPDFAMIHEKLAAGG
jgi:hypothetical protein